MQSGSPSEGLWANDPSLSLFFSGKNLIVGFKPGVNKYSGLFFIEKKSPKKINEMPA